MRFLSMLLLLLLTACADRPSPEATLEQYLEAALHGRYEEAYSLLSSRNIQTLSPLAFNCQAAAVYTLERLVRLANAKYTVEENSLFADGGEALVTVELRFPETDAVRTAIRESHKELLLRGETEANSAEPTLLVGEECRLFYSRQQQDLLKRLHRHNLTRTFGGVITAARFHLVREGAEWRVDLSLDRSTKLSLPILLGNASL